VFPDNSGPRAAFPGCIPVSWRGRSFERKIKSPRNMTRDATRRASSRQRGKYGNLASRFEVGHAQIKVRKMVTKYPPWQLAAPIHISRLMQGTALHH
jgi:hypothetical protein